MKRKKLQNTILFILLALASTTIAQQIYVGRSFGSAAFNEFKNSTNENTLDDSGYTRAEEPLFESGFRFNVYKNKLKFDLGLHYYKHKINTSFYSGNIQIPSTYNLSYAGLKIGFQFDLIRWKKTTFQIHTHVANDWLLFGTNRYKDVLIDLYKEKTLEPYLFNFYRGIGLEHQLSQKVSIYLNYIFSSNFKVNNEKS
jgi:hypothetical protein|tara:strand:- start:6178 stop:6771 length:594 start_codon:yes stop_codon:yes gene_type:complete